MLNTLWNNLFTRTTEKEKACYAPEQSLRFNHSGKVLACCYNRGNVLGRFPEQSIHEIWFGEKAQQLRKALAKDDYSLGCHSCEKEIACGNRTLSGAAQYDYLAEQKPFRNYPTMLDLELGSTCNFECIMCSGEYSTSIRRNREKQKPYYSPYEEHTELFIEQLTPFIPHLKEMRFLGGEPFLMKVYYEIWEKVLEINPSIKLNVLTNASILNKRVKKLLEKGNFHISVSLDSLERENFEKIRKNGIYEEVMANTRYFQNLMKQQGTTMMFNVCAMQQNWEELPSYFAYCQAHNIQVVLHTVKFPSHCSLWNLPAEELEKIVSAYERVSLINETEVQQANRQTFEGLTKQIRHWYEKAAKESPSGATKNWEKEFSEKLGAQKNYGAFDSSKNYHKIITNLVQEFSPPEQQKLWQYLTKIDIQLVIDEVNVASTERLRERLKTVIQNT